MAKPWREVVAQPEFQRLPLGEQKAARDEYFMTVVEPQVPEEDRDAAWQEFVDYTGLPEEDDWETLLTKNLQNAPEMAIRSGANAARGIIETGDYSNLEKAAARRDAEAATRAAERAAIINEKPGDYADTLLRGLDLAGSYGQDFLNDTGRYVDAAQYLAAAVPSKIARTIAGDDAAGKYAQITADQETELKNNAPVIDNPESLKGIANVTQQSLQQLAPGLLATAVTRDPRYTLLTGGVQQGADSYGEQRAAGFDPYQSATAGTLSGVAEAVGEAPALDALFKMGAGPAMKIGESVLKDALGEAVTQALQSAINKGTIDPEMTLDEALRDIRVASLAGAASAGVYAPAIVYTDRQPVPIPPAPTEPVAADTVSSAAPAEAPAAPAAAIAQATTAPQTPPITEAEIRDVIEGDAPIEEVLQKHAPELIPPKPEEAPLQPVDLNVLDAADIPQVEAPSPQVKGETPQVPADSTPSSPTIAETDNDVLLAGTQAASSPFNDRAEPTQAQKEAGNYKKAHVKVQGLNISIETPRAGERSGLDANGQPWSIKMQHDYGYIKRTKGADSEQVDVFLGQNPKSDQVFVIDQVDPTTGKFDEHKVMIGFNSKKEAIDSYINGFSDGKGLDRIGSNPKTLTMKEFKGWLKAGDGKKPFGKLDMVAANKIPERKKAPVVRSTARQRKPVDLLRFLAKKGGIRDDGGDLASMEAQRFIPGAGPLIRPTGLHLDYAREAAVEAGYLPEDADINDLLAAIDASVRGKPTYNAEGMTRQAEMQIEKELQDERDKHPLDAHYGELARKYEIDTTGMGLEDIIEAVHEREALQADGADAEELRASQESDIDSYLAQSYPELARQFESAGLTVEEDIPFGDANDTAAKTPPQQEAPRVPDESRTSSENTTGQKEADKNSERTAVSSEARNESAPALSTEQTAAGVQTVVPGAEKISNKALAERKMQGRKKSEKPQQAADEGLFDIGARNQADMFNSGTRTPERVQETPKNEQVATVREKVSPQLNLPDPAKLTPEALYRTERKIEKAFKDDAALPEAERMTDAEFVVLEDYARRLEQEIKTRGKPAMAAKLKKQPSPKVEKDDALAASPSEKTEEPTFARSATGGPIPTTGFLKGKNYYWNPKTSFTAKEAQAQKLIEEVLRDKFGAGARIRWAETITDKDGNLINGVFSKENGAAIIGIALSQDTKAPLATFQHEGIHLLRRAGAFTKEEWNTLTAKARGKWFADYDITNRYEKYAPEGMSEPAKQAWLEEEAIAEAYAHYSTGYSEFTATEKSIFKRIRDFYEALKDAVKKAFGIETWKDVFEKVETGKKRVDLSRDNEENVTRFNVSAKQAIFYSTLRRGVQDVKQAKAPAAQWKAILRNMAAKGVKIEELEWSGVNEWLDSQQGAVTKEALLNYLDTDGRVDVQEVMKEDIKVNRNSKYALPEVERAMRRAGDNQGELVLTLENDGDAYRALMKKFPELEENEDWAEVVAKDVFGANTRATKYGQYTLPGADNYRELLITLPVKPYEDEGKAVPVDAGSDNPFSGAPIREPNRTAFRSGHWDEPNVLAHIRLNDRTDADGKKVLFVEEVQSDWHQKGRKKGYTSDFDKKAIEKEFAEADKSVRDIGERLTALMSKETKELNAGGDYDAVTEKSRPRMAELEQERNNLLQRQQELREMLNARLEALPDAPFKKTWHELAMKRVLRYAVEHGYDRVAWAPGDVHTERYNLSKQLSKIVITKTSGGGYVPEHGPFEKEGDDAYLRAYDKNGKEVISQRIESPKELEDYIGKDAAERLMKQPTVSGQFGGLGAKEKKLEGLELKVGGEGMRGFYDKILPEYMNKYVKKWGSQVGNTTIEGQDGLVHQQRYTGPIHTEKYVMNRARDLNATLGRQARDVAAAMDEGASYKDAMEAHASVGLAQEFGGKLTSMPKQFSVQSVDITPQMRESVEQGQPLFQRPNDFQNFTLPDQGVFDALRDRNRSMLQRVSKAASGRALKTSFDEFRRYMQDRFIGFRRVQQGIEQTTGEKIAESANVIRAEETFTGRAGYKLDKLYEKHFKPLFENISKLEKKIGDTALSRVDEFLYALHAPERNAQIKKIAKDGTKFADTPADLLQAAKDGVPGSGMSDAEAAKIIEQAKKDGIYDDLSAIAAQARTILDNSLDERVRMMLTKPESAAAMREAYKNYFPLRGQKELGIEGQTRFGKGFSIRGEEFKRAEGRQSMADDLLANILAIAEESIIRGEKNRVALALYNLAITNPNPNLWTARKRKQIYKLNEATGVMEWVPEQAPKGFKYDDATVFAKVNGEEVQIELKDKRLAEAMKNLNTMRGGSIVKMLMGLNHYLSMTHTMLNPEFVITNAFRDIQTAMINSQSYDVENIAKHTARDYFKALNAVWRGLNWDDSASGKLAVGKFRPFKDAAESKEWLDYYHEYAAAGGKVAFWKMDDVNEKRAKLAAEIGIRRDGKFNYTKRQAKAVFELVETVNTAVDNGVRLSAYVQGRRAGMSKADAASLAKNLTVNFNRRGEYGPYVNALYLFANASTQGTAVMWAAMKHRKVQKITLGIAAFGYAWGMMMAMMSPTDDDEALVWDKIPEYEKEANLIIVFPDGKLGDAIKKALPWNVKSGVEYAKIPLPYGYRVFNYLGQNAEDWQRGAKKPWDAIGNVTKSIVNNFNPIGSDATWWNTLAPTALDPVAAIGTNTNPLTGKQIMPSANQFDAAPPPDSQQYFPNVRYISKEIADGLNSVTGGDHVVPGAIDVSPETLDYLFDYFTGSAGAFLARLTDMGANLFTGKEMGINDIVFARKVLGATSPWADKSTAYDRMHEIDAQADRYSTYLKTDPEKAEQFYQDNKELIDMRGKKEFAATAVGARAKLSDLRKQRMLLDQAVMSASEKKELMDTLDQAEEQIVNTFNATYNRAMKKTAGDTRPFAEQPKPQ